MSFAHSARQLLCELFDAAVAAARGADMVAGNASVQGDLWCWHGPGGPAEVPLPPPGQGRVLVLGAGKAAASLARGLERVLGGRIDDGVVIVKYGHGEQLERVRVLEAGHPQPDRAGLHCTRELLHVLAQAGESDTIFFLLTGGASALLVAPVRSLSFEDLAETDRLLVNSGATIEEINIVRKHLCAVKGGRLIEAVRCRALCTLAISDVPGDDIATIGSGPTVADSSTFTDAICVIERYGLRERLPAAALDHLRRGAAGLEAETLKTNPVGSQHSTYRIVASNQLSLQASLSKAGELGCQAEVVWHQMCGNTHEAARGFAAALRAASIRAAACAMPIVLLAGGETTLAVAGAGRGGRNQEFALTAALELTGLPNVMLLSAGTDGTDGPTDAAGAFADGTSVARAHRLGLDPRDHLRRNDAYPLLQALGDLHITGPTGTNVMDLAIGIAW